jgi:DNA-binding transcriptional LysR family regulator
MAEPEVALAVAQAHLTRTGLTGLDRCPVQNLGSASLPNLNRMRHQVRTNAQTAYGFNRESIIPQVHYSHEDIAVYARFWYSLWGDTGVLREVSLLDDLLALVEFAQAGSITGAADRLYRTPSAITRQLQRLEAALGAELLDRSVKPPRLNSLGSRVLEQARDVLQRTEAIKSTASRDAEPHGLLRIGLAHPLAEGTLIEPIRALTETYPKVRLLLLSERTPELFNRLTAGELDVAVVPLPEGKTAPPPLLTNIIATDRVEIVQSVAGNVDGDWESLGRAPWVLNPPGCFLRAGLIDRMGRAGFTPMIAAEIHNMHLQLAFVQSGYGVGLLPARFIAGNNSLDTVEVLRPPSFELHMSVAIVRVGQLGALEKTVGLLEHGIWHLFEAANTNEPVSRSRKGVPANRRKTRLRK